MRRERKGLSSVIGAIFMILVMAAALNVALWTMQQQDRVTEAVVEKANSNLGKLNEDVAISDARVSGKKLNVTVANPGGAAAILKSIYIVNETAKQQFRYDLGDIAVDGRNSVKNIGQSLPLVVKNDTDYSIKVVTESGNTASSKITSLSKVALPMSLYIIPPTVTPNENVTVLFTVTNNITDSSLGWAVVPKLQYTCSGCTLTKYSEPSASPVMIGKGSTGLFKWVYKVSGPDKTTVSFNATLANAKQGNYATEKALIKLVDSAQTSFSSEIIISSTLVQKPEIFVLIPSPFGKSSEKGLWGVVVANPTNQTMQVSRLVINAYSSKNVGGGSTEIIANGCAETPIFPTPSSEWSCPHANMIEWKNVGSPQTIGGFESKSFLAKVPTGNIADPESAFTVTVSVFTNMGQFTKTGYASGISDTTMSLGSVYLTTNTADPLSTTNMRGHINGITSGQTVRLNVTVADLDTPNTTYIKSGTRLIVNVPRGFTNINVESYAGFDAPTKIPYSDGSTQIVAVLKTNPSPENLGDVANGEAKVLTFTAQAPVSNSTRVYIMHTLLDGESHSSSVDDFSVGAVAELALQVLKSS